MKAMILAAGFGQRLLPYTRSTPKPLFTIGGETLLGIMIRKLEKAGCNGIIINTHHLHHRIEEFLEGNKFHVPVVTRFEPEILGTGGGIKNASDFFDDAPFLVVNSDIIIDADLTAVYEYHKNHPHPVTLVLYDDAEFNSVSVDEEGFVTGFNGQKPAYAKSLTFTGIQVLDKTALGFIPENGFSGSIPAYEKLLSKGHKIRAYIISRGIWKDVGSPERYRETTARISAEKAFQIPWPDMEVKDDRIRFKPLAGDGSDRIWRRVFHGEKTLILGDHGIRTASGTTEVDAFVNIGKHLHGKGIPVPKIYLYDLFSGLVFMEDLGDLHLQQAVLGLGYGEGTCDLYKTVIDNIINLSINGDEDFNPSWCHQTPSYDKDVILENECRYFLRAFVEKRMGLTTRWEEFEGEFSILGDLALEYGVTGFMHRDMQSRNIMVLGKDIRFTDFQGGRRGPIQYDLASLLIDPYVSLPGELQARLLAYSFERLALRKDISWETFLLSYKHCAICRNLQILGAFGFLSLEKGKKQFESYIPAALLSLKSLLSGVDNRQFPALCNLVQRKLLL